MSILTKRLPLIVLLGLVPAMALMFLISLVAPVAAAIALTAIVIGAICGLAIDLHAREVKDMTQSNRLINTLLEKQVQPARRLVILDPETTLFKRWYFDLRLSEELNRCKRYGSPMAMIAVRRAASSSKAEPQVPRETEVDFVKVFMRNVRTLDLATKLNESDYCICLPHTDRGGAESVATRLLAEVGTAQISVGVAEYSSEDKESDLIIERAFAGTVAAAVFQAVPKLEKKRADYKELLERVRIEEAGQVALAPDETPSGVKARLRRAAKTAGVVLRLTDREGTVYFERIARQETQSQVA